MPASNLRQWPLLLHISTAAAKPRPRFSGADLVLRPVEPRLQGGRPVVGLEAEQAAVVHLRRGDDLAGVHEPLRIERLLDLGERARQPRAVHGLDPLGAHETVAVLAGVRAFVFLDERARFLGDRAHLLGAVLRAQIQHRAYVQAADRRVRIERAARAVLREHVRQALGVLGEVLERHGAVLDERHGFTVALHRHHDVEAGLADLPHVALPGRVDDLDDAAGQTEVAHELAQAAQLRELGRLLVARELDEQDRVGLAADRLVHRRAEGGDVARQLDHRPVDELDGRGLERDDVPREVHRLIESREVHDAERLVRRQRRQLELDLAEQPERSFGADQQLREIERVRRRQVEVVAGDAPLQLRHARFDLVALARVQLAHLGHELAMSEPSRPAGRRRRRRRSAFRRS